MYKRYRTIALAGLLLVCLSIYKVRRRKIATGEREKHDSDARRKLQQLKSFSKDMHSFWSHKFLKNLPQRRPLYHFTMQPWAVKSVVYDPGDKLSMVIVVKSHVRNKNFRKFARETWSKHNNLQYIRFETIFIVGNAFGAADREIKKENKKHGDILQINVNDTYKNLVHKTAAGMQFIMSNFPKTWFYASMDDDVLPDFQNITLNLQAIIAEEFEHRGVYLDSKYLTGGNLIDINIPVYCGFGYKVNPRPERNPKKLWYVGKKKYPLLRYPPYCFGGFYAMTIKVAAELHEVARETPLFWIDDIWLTGFVRLKYFAGYETECKHCQVMNTTVGIWTNLKGELTAGVTGDETFLRQQWKTYQPQL